MPKKPEGYAEKVNSEGRIVKDREPGVWRGRVTWGTDTCKCDHPSESHPLVPGKRRYTFTRGACGLCTDCKKFTALRREWRRVADPNTKAKALEIARERAAEIARDLEAGRPVRAEIALSSKPEERRVADACALYLAAYVKPPVYENGEKLSGMQDHARTRRVIEDVIVPRIGNMDVAAVTFDDLRDLRETLEKLPKKRPSGSRDGKTVEIAGTKVSTARVNRIMAVVRAIFNFAATEKRWIPSNPMNVGRRDKSLVKMRAETPRDRVLTRAEEAAMLAAYPKRSRDVFIVALYTGMRMREIELLEVSAVDFTENVLELPWSITKTKKKRTVPMSKNVRRIMRARCSKRAATDRVFGDLSRQQIRDDFETARIAAKVENFQIRDCRATIATRLHAAGISEIDIAALTGHRMQRGGEAPILRKHYIRLTGDTIDRAIAAIDKGTVN